MRSALFAVLVTASCSVPVAEEASLVDGRPATADESRGIAAIVLRTSGRVACTGTLVAPDAIVTAAHCLADLGPGGDDAVVVVSATRIDEPALVQHAIAGARAHPGFPQPISPDPATLGADRDIAVLLLETSVDEDPIPLSASDAALVPGAALTIAGYGIDDAALRTGDGVLRIGETVLSRRTDAEMLAGEGATADTCYRDSGGPAFVEIDGRRELAGVTSRRSGTAAAECGDGTIFTIVPAHRDFIDETIAALRRERAGGCSVHGRGSVSSWCLVALAIALVRGRSRPHPSG